jgi:FHS family glucose/mannose:H+ symporter-like MFS transporter
VTSPSPVQSPSARSTMAFWIHAQFTLIGITTVLLGPLLPTLAVHWGMHDLQKGYFFAAQYVGSTLGSLLSTRALPRWGFTRVCTGAMLILCSGLEIFVLGPWRVGLAGVFLCGLGMALAVAGSNLAVAESNPGRAASALSLLNFAWGIGAVACPFLIAAGLRYLPLTSLVPALGVLPLLFALRFAAFTSAGEIPATAASGTTPASTPWRLLPFVLITTLAFLYVGTENALGGWIASYARDFAPVSAASAAMAPSAFWAALLTGRGLAPTVLRSHSERTIYRLGLLTALLGTILVLTTHLVPFLLTGAAIAGFGLAALFPITVAVLSRDLGENSNRLGGFFFAIGNMGGATIPFLVGAMSSYTHSLHAGMALTLVAMALMLAISLTFSQRLAFSAQEAR